jgi:hypothetical protein
MSNYVPVYYIEEDARQRGPETTDLIEGAQPLARAGLPGFVSRYDCVFHW